ncbi:Cyanovirin-N [Cercophora newfieldiana]|uniref:Cyanovirin-N n=1 Tax=Cercophora newfieldiana TaxID=92897 RepID=A0AA40CS02_9PEZI|nr:Cyanovirin-N [Cercophora newfieldiana]
MVPSWLPHFARTLQPTGQAFDRVGTPLLPLAKQEVTDRVISIWFQRRTKGCRSVDRLRPPQIGQLSAARHLPPSNRGLPPFQTSFSFLFFKTTVIMSFHGSAQNIRVDDGHILRATLFNAEGEEVEAEIDLDTIIGNDNGFFSWGGENFSHSAEHVNFSIEGDDSVPILRAHLADVEGNVNERDVNLAERIGNDNGSFVFIRSISGVSETRTDSD